ncbi:tyrosine-type recombinase/integrase [Pelagibacterium sp.]|uniref:tyrosine-type recombinase/integrase n=1 Tax=Pelagibacterium sp. TaxID=1967288 RepID=UPI003A9053FA
MGQLEKSEIDTPSKRARLEPRKNPYWVGVSGGRGGVSLGYRKPARAHGSWVAKVVLEGNRVEERLGAADDDGAPHGALTYRKAVAASLEWGHQQHAAIEGREASAPRTGPTVTTAVNEYVKERLARSKRDGTISQGRLENYVLSDEAFAKTPLSKLRAATIQQWRERLTAEPSPDDDRKRLAASSVNRLLNDLRAALNASAEKHRRQLPAALPAEIKVGTRSTRVATEARKQLLSDEQIKAVIDAAFAVDADGDFGRLTLLAASTGARYSQLTRIRVGGLQIQNKRIMVPGASKGRSATARPPVAVPLSDAVIERLLPAAEGRAADEPLLMRWAYRNIGPFKWEKDVRRPWGPAYEIEKPWAATVELAEVPTDTIMYALRHTSIVRGLKVGLPIRLVASLHDTSSEMIEKHYSAFIVDMTEDLARRAALTF